MLTLTDSAVTAIRNLTSQPELPDDTGLRIMAQGEGAPAFQVALAENPVEGDQVIEAEGARVFLEPGAALALDDKSLDAQVDDQGTVAFTLGEQAS
ncbi:MAG TPA: Fe-S cluster assembly protein HesB [Streptosporangiaceae bacterium]|jgi:Fe-S cluster assembly iron-binding protein IscA|nr:Fe-S cluster assembly protein HesB [Streptosporangiaceae bacterium]